jgi:hypothetical protein
MPRPLLDRGPAPSYRYGAVFLLTLLLVVFLIAAPEAQWSRAVAILIAGATLLVAIGTARAGRITRRSGETAVLLVSVVVFLGTVTGVFPRSIASVAGVILTGALPPVIVRGNLRLAHERGVTIQLVSGALVIYLSIGVFAAWVISFVTQVSHTPYFAQHATSTLSDRVYFSFTTLTTTGFGDFTPATSVGRAIAVVEMVLGQLYLVTVIGLLIGNLVGRRRPPSSSAE